MQRRTFIKNTALASAALAVSPLFSQASSIFSAKRCRHVILCILGGGVRIDEIEKGYMPLMMDLPGIFFNNLRYGGGEITHSAGHRAILTGSYTSSGTILKTAYDAGIKTRWFYDPLTSYQWDIQGEERFSSLPTSLLSSNERTFTALNIQGMDAAHFNYTDYCSSLAKADRIISRLFDDVTSLKKWEDTIMLVCPDHGRNKDFNDITGVDGTGGLDHYDDHSRKVFCKIISPDLSSVASNEPGEILDVTATIAGLLNIDHSANGKTLLNQNRLC